MPSRFLKILIFAYIIFFIIIDISAITKLLLFAEGLPKDWGLIGRLFLPLIFLVVSFKSKEINIKFSLYFFSAARFLYYNSIIFYNKINIAFIIIILVFFLDILTLYQTTKIDKLFLIKNASSQKIIKLFLIVIGLFCAALLCTTILMGIRKSGLGIIN